MLGHSLLWGTVPSIAECVAASLAFCSLYASSISFMTIKNIPGWGKITLAENYWVNEMESELTHVKGLGQCLAQGKPR